MDKTRAGGRRVKNTSGRLEDKKIPVMSGERALVKLKIKAERKVGTRASEREKEREIRVGAKRQCRARKRKKETIAQRATTKLLLTAV